MSMSMNFFYCYRMRDQMYENSIFFYDKQKSLIKKINSKKMSGVVDSENENKIFANHTLRAHKE